jgi:hypothetical protein
MFSLGPTAKTSIVSPSYERNHDRSTDQVFIPLYHPTYSTPNGRCLPFNILCTTDSTTHLTAASSLLAAPQRQGMVSRLPCCERWFLTPRHLTGISDVVINLSSQCSTSGPPLLSPRPINKDIPIDLRSEYNPISRRAMLGDIEVSSPPNSKSTSD